MSICASFTCNLSLLISRMWYFSTVFRHFHFFCFHDVHCLRYTPICMSCTQYMARIPCITVIIPNCLYMYIWCKFSAFLIAEHLVFILKTSSNGNARQWNVMTELLWLLCYLQIWSICISCHCWHNSSALPSRSCMQLIQNGLHARNLR
jgi:hypothetical protein